jgi:hypothetical protein
MQGMPLHPWKLSPWFVINRLLRMISRSSKKLSRWHTIPILPRLSFKFEVFCDADGAPSLSHSFSLAKKMVVFKTVGN